MYCFSFECADQSSRETDDKARFNWNEDCCWERSRSTVAINAVCILNTRDCVLMAYPNTEKRVENTTGSGVFLTKFKVF